MAELDEFREAKERGLDRILALSDGVFAFALTLLALDLAVPALAPNQDVSMLPGLLAGEWSGFFSYFLSFAMIAVWWNNHQHYFEYVKGYDGNLKALNLLTLLTITLIPYFTKLLNEWVASPAAVSLYATNQGATATFLALTWRYITKKPQFIGGRLDQKTVDRMRITGTIPAVVFFLSIPLAYIGFFFFATPQVAWIIWYAIFPISYFARRKYSR
jgi:uncharacterized membrane protein